MAQASSSVSLQRPGAIRFGPFRFDRVSGILQRDDKELYLPPRALNVLQVLVERCGEVVSKDELVEVVWHDATVTDQSPAEAIGVVRETLGDDSHDPTYIQTIHRRGYRFIAEVEAEAETRDAPPAATRPWFRRVDPSSAPAGVVSPEPFRLRLAAPTWIALAIAAALAVVVTLFLLVSQRQVEHRSPALRLALALPHPVLPTTPPSIALSPDGTCLVYRAAFDGGGGLYVLYLDRFEQRRLEGTEGGFGPFFSPNGQWLGYFEEGHLWKIFLRGGPPVEVAKTTEGPVSGASWGDDGTIVFAQGPRSKLWRISADGGQPTLLAAPDLHAGEYGYSWPEVLPGSEWVLFTIEPVGIALVEDFRMASVSLRNREVRRLEVAGGIQPRLLGRHQLVFARRASLFAAPFNPRGPEVIGSAEPIVQDVMTLNRGAGQFAVSAAGVLVYIPGDALASTLQWIGRNGDSEDVPVPPGTFGRHRLSPEHRSLALEIDGDIWIYDFERGALTRFTTTKAGELLPLWSSDGTSLVFSSNREGPFHLFIKPVDGSRAEEVLLRSAYPKLADSWSSDGRWLAFTEIHPVTGRDLWLLPMPEAGEARPLLRTGFDESQASFAPDGSWVAFVSNEPGTFEVFVQPFPGPGPRYQVSIGGGSSPQWSPSGNELFFAVGDTLVAVAIESASPFRVGAPRRVLEIPNSNSFFAVGPEGYRFLVGKRLQSVRPNKLHLVTDGASLILDSGHPG